MGCIRSCMMLCAMVMQSHQWAIFFERRLDALDQNALGSLVAEDMNGVAKAREELGK